MNIPAIQGVIRRRILLNYVVDPDIVRRILPSRFSPKLVGGKALVGICLIRLEKVRPKGLPLPIGMSSENAAHRISVEWHDDQGTLQEGVFIPRRDTDSRWNSFAGGRLFPGVHHQAHFEVSDSGGSIELRVTSGEGEPPLVDLQAHETSEFPRSSLFASLSEASDFHERGCIGYSSRPDSCVLDGLLLDVEHWQVTPLEVERLQSSYYDDPSVFPGGSITFDHALVMRDIRHEWHSRERLTAEPTMV